MVHPSEGMKQRCIPSLGFQEKLQEDGTFEGRPEAQKEFTGGGAFFATLQTVAHQSPLSMGFFRREYCSGLPFPPPGNLPNPGTNPCLLCLLHWQVDSLPLSPLGEQSHRQRECAKALRWKGEGKFEEQKGRWI